jgi:hypothetical protein
MSDVPRKNPEPDVAVTDYPRAVTRRTFLMSWAGVAWGTFAVTSGLGVLAMLRYMLPNVLFEPVQVFKAGRLEDYGL